MSNKQSEIPFNVLASRCPSRTSFEHIFSRWGVLIMARLTEGPSRFNELARSVEGISERMLSKSLKLLEEEGLIYREDFNEKLPRVEYGLTVSGRRIAGSVLKVIEQLYEEMELRKKNLCT
ncbi:MAG: helix-turn-helix domain-containing protein [Spirochaetaceae bacterium]|jgi:DNA-binding HxlR family transcriptional regulator|nr:helix-turn-helix domain-containing protein [Spirochaetaceae bacterium]